jgi:SAM-dependent methyltransferase
MSASKRKPGPEDYGKEYYEKAFGLDDLEPFGMHWWSVRFYAKLAARVLRASGGRRVLEVGCAHGYTLGWLEREFETVGIDLSAYAVERARKEAPRSTVYRADLLGDLPDDVARGGFDLILAKYVLEHLPDPLFALRRLRGLLAPGGALLYSVPDLRSPSRPRRGEQWYAYLDETHVSLLEPDEWLRLTRQAGLSVEQTFSDGVWDMPWVSYLPTILQYPIFCLPTIATVFLARPLLEAGTGENLIVVARAGDAP